MTRDFWFDRPITLPEIVSERMGRGYLTNWFFFLCLGAWTCFPCEARAAVIRPLPNSTPGPSAPPSIREPGCLSGERLPDAWIPYHTEFAELSDYLSKNARTHPACSFTYPFVLGSPRSFDEGEGMGSQIQFEDSSPDWESSATVFCLMWGRIKASLQSAPWGAGRSTRERQTVPQAGILDGDEWLPPDSISRLAGEWNTCASIIYLSHLFRPPRFVNRSFIE